MHTFYSITLLLFCYCYVVVMLLFVLIHQLVEETNQNKEWVVGDRQEKRVGR